MLIQVGFSQCDKLVCGLQLTNNKEKMFKYGFGHRDINQLAKSETDIKA